MKTYDVTVCDDGRVEWRFEGLLHREDGPAVENANGDKEWWLNGKLHREDGPSIECTNGSKFWFKNDVLHRVDGPAIEFSSGCKKWFLNGESISEIVHAYKTFSIFNERPPKSTPLLNFNYFIFDLRHYEDPCNQAHCFDPCNQAHCFDPYEKRGYKDIYEKRDYYITPPNKKNRW